MWLTPIQPFEHGSHAPPTRQAKGKGTIDLRCLNEAGRAAGTVAAVAGSPMTHQVKSLAVPILFADFSEEEVQMPMEALKVSH